MKFCRVTSDLPGRLSSQKDSYALCGRVYEVLLFHWWELSNEVAKSGIKTVG